LELCSNLFSPFQNARPVCPDSVLRDGDQVNELKVIHIPGHTPSSKVLLDKERSIMFVGDTLSHSKGRLRPDHKTFSLNYEAIMTSTAKISEYKFEVLLYSLGEPLVVMHPAWYYVVSPVSEVPPV